MMIDRGAIGAKGFLPHRLLSLLKTKRLWLVKSDGESVKALMEKESIGSIENKTMSCEFSLVDSKEIWGQIECKINYPDLIFRVENGHSILKLEGVAALVDPALEKKEVFKFPDVNLKLTDQELLKMFESTLDITLSIPEEPKKVSKNITFVCELKDNISGVIYKAKTVSKK